MNLKLHLWKEWLICKRTYLLYIFLIYVLVNLMLLSLASFKIDHNTNIELISIDYIFRLIFVYIATIFMLMSMINQSIGLERISGHIHSLLAYKVSLSRIILCKAIFIVLITFFELIIMAVIYFWNFWGNLNFSFSMFILTILIILTTISSVLFLASINITACYIFPKFSQLFSIISFGFSFVILAYYKSIVAYLINYFGLFFIVGICILATLEYLLYLLVNRIPNNIILKS
jgi:hypothetical protein